MALEIKVLLTQLLNQISKTLHQECRMEVHLFPVLTLKVNHKMNQVSKNDRDKNTNQKVYQCNNLSKMYQLIFVKPKQSLPSFYHQLAIIKIMNKKKKQQKTMLSIRNKEQAVIIMLIVQLKHLTLNLKLQSKLYKEAALHSHQLLLLVGISWIL